jgi:hypothetical protein
MGGQGIHCQDAFIGKAPLTARDESCQELAICRNITAGIIVDLAVLHQHIHGGITDFWKVKLSEVPPLESVGCIGNVTGHGRLSITNHSTCQDPVNRRVSSQARLSTFMKNPSVGQVFRQ